MILYFKMNNYILIFLKILLKQPKCFISFVYAILVPFQPSKRGESKTFDNSKGDTVLFKELKGSFFGLVGGSLNEDVEAVDCKVVNRAKFNAATARRRNGNSGYNCDGVVFPANKACMAYDDPDCRVDKWKEPLAFACGEEKSFSRASLTGVKLVFITFL